MVNDEATSETDASLLPTLLWGSTALLAAAVAAVVSFGPLAGATRSFMPDPVTTGGVVESLRQPGPSPGIDPTAFEREKGRSDAVIKLVMALQDQADAANRRLSALE